VSEGAPRLERAAEPEHPIMAVTLIGLVAYADTITPERPFGAVFRIVFPSFDDAELDDPQWIRMGCDPTRAVLTKVGADTREAQTPMTGTP
jgi:hypothetical protein